MAAGRDPGLVRPQHRQALSGVRLVPLEIRMLVRRQRVQHLDPLLPGVLPELVDPPGLGGGPVGVGRATAKSMFANIIGIHLIGLLGTQIFWGSNPRSPIGG